MILLGLLVKSFSDLIIDENIVDRLAEACRERHANSRPKNEGGSIHSVVIGVECDGKRRVECEELRELGPIHAFSVVLLIISNLDIAD